MKYKIQTAAYSGWADLKTSEGDSDVYTVCLFDTLGEAQSELADLANYDTASDWRIVTEDTPADCDIYECEGWSVA
jgi:hypothetical protein